jgi:hypothetical protein
MRTLIELTTLFLALTCAIFLFIFHIIYVTNSSNANVNCLMEYFDGQNFSKPSLAMNQYDVMKLNILTAPSYGSAEVCTAESSSQLECVAWNANKPYSPAVNRNNNVYYFAMEKGTLMLADKTMLDHNFTMLELSFPADASCFGPPLTSHIIREYLGYDLIVMNWAVAAFEGQGFMYKKLTREVFNLNLGADFVSKKGVSLEDEKRSVRYMDTIEALPSLVMDGLHRMGIDEVGGMMVQGAFARLGSAWSALWEAIEGSPVLRPAADYLSWVFADEFLVAGADGTAVGATASTNSMLYLIYSAATITNTRWKYISQSLPSLYQYVMFRMGVVLSIAFLFFVTTSLVSFTLRETQERMLRFTFQLQHHIHHNRPYWALVFSHLVENLVFVPIVMGIHFFLVEFFSDQLVRRLSFSLPPA